MSLLDILWPSDEQIEASERQAGGRSRTVMRLANEGNRDDRKRALLKIRKARYRRRHPGLEKDIPKLRAWTAAHPERFRRYQARWQRENRVRVNAAAQRYRAKKKRKREAACGAST